MVALWTLAYLVSQRRLSYSRRVRHVMSPVEEHKTFTETELGDSEKPRADWHCRARSVPVSEGRVPGHPLFWLALGRWHWGTEQIQAGLMAEGW